LHTELKEHMKINNEATLFKISLAAIFIVYVLFMMLDIMEVDAAQYATIAWEMMQSKSYLQVYHRGLDYLDKPPLLFWMSSLSFSALGIHNFAYKLPAVLFLLLGLVSTYKFCELWYNTTTARFSTLILATCQAYFLMVNDVRTDGLLTGASIFTIWQISVYLKSGKNINLVWAVVGLALGMMAKGAIAYIIIISAIGGHLLLTLNWKAIFNYKWLLGVVGVLILLSPMCYGLYQQFDLHPEKFVYGLQGPSGLRFYFWIQSFGRITGENYWQNDTGFFFFFHTILWDFQPWIFLFIPALFSAIKAIFTKTYKESISLFGFVLPFLALSTSHYKLPHYIFVLLPFAAVITADFLISRKQKTMELISKITFGFYTAYFILGGLCIFYFFPEKSILLISAWTIGLVVYFFIFYKLPKNAPQRLLYPIVWAAICLGFIMSKSLYPNLLQYQAGAMAGKTYHKTGAGNPFYLFKEGESFALDYYSQKIVNPADSTKMADYPIGTLLYASAEGKVRLDQEFGDTYKQEKEFDYFPVTRLSINFLRPEKREKTLEKKYLYRKVK
jgi:4-amino-4-deoxy-L-arabinose transferase-like glycosyltransferase